MLIFWISYEGTISIFLEDCKDGQPALLAIPQYVFHCLKLCYSQKEKNSQGDESNNVVHVVLSLPLSLFQCHTRSQTHMLCHKFFELYSTSSLGTLTQGIFAVSFHVQNQLILESLELTIKSEERRGEHVHFVCFLYIFTHGL